MAVNRWVAGSSPARGANFFRDLEIYDRAQHGPLVQYWFSETAYCPYSAEIWSHTLKSPRQALPAILSQI